MKRFTGGLPPGKPTFARQPAGFAVLTAAFAISITVATTMRSGAGFLDHPEGAGFERGDRAVIDNRGRLEFRGTQPGSDGGLPVIRERDDAPGLSGPASAALRDSRQGNTVHRFDGQFRQAVYGRLVGYEESTFGKTCIPRRCLNDADLLSNRAAWFMGQSRLFAQRKPPAAHCHRGLDTDQSNRLNLASWSCADRAEPARIRQSALLRLRWKLRT